MQVQSENGLMHVAVPKDAFRNYVNGQYIWSPTLKGYIEQGVASSSDRRIVRLLNLILHRNSDIDSIKLRTVTDLVESEGQSYLSAMTAWGNSTLETHNWNSDTGLPKENAFLSEGISAYDKTAYGPKLTETEKETHSTQIEQLVEQINTDKPEDFKIPEELTDPKTVEADSSKAVIVSLDGVCSKRQKDTRPPKDPNEPFFQRDELEGPEDLRRAPDPKKRPKVETAVAHIDFDGKKYVMADTNMFALCKLVLAFLLHHGLLEDRKLIFLSDGGKDIKAAVEHVFAFCPYVIMLDWYHLKKHCLEMLSMSVVGGKKHRDIQWEIRRNLFRRLFNGNVDGAQNYLASLDRIWIKNQVMLQGLSDYLERKRSTIACYSLRKRMGLRISSNRVEKVNDMIVSERQKGKGMSWSREGSWSLAVLTTKYLNHENENWSQSHTIGFEPYQQYQSLFDFKNNTSIKMIA